MSWLEKGPETSLLQGFYSALMLHSLSTVFTTQRTGTGHLPSAALSVRLQRPLASRRPGAESTRQQWQCGQKVAVPHSPPCTCLLARAQLDKLRTIIESMLASSSTLLSMSMTPRQIPTASAPSQIDPETTCPACSLDLGHQVSMLVQRYEQLQDMVTNLAATRPSKKAKLQSQVIPAGLPPRVATHGPQRGSHSSEAHRAGSGWWSFNGPEGQFSIVELFIDPTTVPGPFTGSQWGQQQSWLWGQETTEKSWLRRGGAAELAEVKGHVSVCLGDAGIALGFIKSPSCQPSSTVLNSPQKGRLAGGGRDRHKSLSPTSWTLEFRPGSGQMGRP